MEEEKVIFDAVIPDEKGNLIMYLDYGKETQRIVGKKLLMEKCLIVL